MSWSSVWLPARLTVFKIRPQLVQPLPSSLGSAPCCFLQASLSNPVVDTTGNLIAPNLFGSIGINIPLKALPSEELSPLQLSSALAKFPHTHRTSFSIISCIWGNSWTTPAVSLHEHFGKWSDNLSPSWALRLAGGGLQVKLTVCKIFEVKGRGVENQWNFPSHLGCVPFPLCCLSSPKGAQLAYFFPIILILW